MKVVNFYTGYQTYRTAGIAHSDNRIVKHLESGWFEPLIEIAGKLGAGIGFSYHAFPLESLKCQEAYDEKLSEVIKHYADICQIATKHNVLLSSEQMYAPHQHPWRITENMEFLKSVNKLCSDVFYTTIDVGHQIGQMLFVKPTRNEIKEYIIACKNGEKEPEDFWLGNDAAMEQFYSAISSNRSSDDFIDCCCEKMELTPYMFSKKEDSDTYRWLTKLGAYSPIMHLQQNNGLTAHHAGFTAKNNKDGIITGDKMLNAIWESYLATPEDGMPKKVDNIYLSFELFFSNTTNINKGLKELKDSVEYWRQFIPEDGLELEELISHIK